MASTIYAVENRVEAMRQGIREETGYDIRDLMHVATLYVSRADSAERIILFYVEVDAAARVVLAGAVQAEGEDIHVCTW